MLDEREIVETTVQGLLSAADLVVEQRYWPAIAADPYVLAQIEFVACSLSMLVEQLRAA